MKKWVTRLAALILIPCLAADPATALGFHDLRTCQISPSPAAAYFQAQALTGLGLWWHKTLEQTQLAYQGRQEAGRLGTQLGMSRRDLLFVLGLVSVGIAAAS